MNKAPGRVGDAARHMRQAELSLKAAMDECEVDARAQVLVDRLRRGMAGARRITRKIAGAR